MSVLEIKRILVGVDDSEDALLAFDYAIERAKREDLELVIVSVLENDEMNVYQALNKDLSTANMRILKTTYENIKIKPMCAV